MRVLIVEDEPSSRLTLMEFLATLADCDAVDDGAAAPEAFRKALQEGRPYDLVCLDIVMPGLSGHEVLQRIRAMEEGAGLPQGQGARVLMVTAMEDADNMVGAFQGTAAAYLVKPFSRAQLVEQLRLLGFDRPPESG